MTTVLQYQKYAVVCFNLDRIHETGKFTPKRLSRPGNFVYENLVKRQKAIPLLKVTHKKVHACISKHRPPSLPAIHVCRCFTVNV